MIIDRFLRRSITTLATCLLIGSAQAGVVLVAGTDALSLHNVVTFTNPVLKTLQGSSTKSVLVIGNDSFTNTSGVTTVNGGSLLTASFASSLSSYSAILFQSPCCEDPASRLNGFQASVDAFVDAGGSIFIEDYQGNAIWNSILNISTATVGAKVDNLLVCRDPGVSTAAGLALGFQASYNSGCFVHQTYVNSYWSGQGFVALQTTQSGQFVTMAKVVGGPAAAVPEPASMGLVGFALLGLAVARRGRRTRRN